MLSLDIAYGGSMEQNEQIWKRFTKKEKDRFINQVCKGWRWKQYAKLFSHYFDDWQEMREFGRWVKANVINKKAEPKIQVEEVVLGRTNLDQLRWTKTTKLHPQR